MKIGKEAQNLKQKLQFRIPPENEEIIIRGKYTDPKLDAKLKLLKGETSFSHIEIEITMAYCAKI